VACLGTKERCSTRPRSALRATDTGTIAKAERQARPLLEQHGRDIEPAGTPIKTLVGLTAYASAHGIELTRKAKPAR
jgi:hypothetical protein